MRKQKVGPEELFEELGIKANEGDLTYAGKTEPKGG